MFCLMDPLKRKGVWGITEMCFLNECSPIFSASQPPTLSTDPSSGSTNLNNTCMIDDFPAPVLPTIPRRLPAGAVRVTSLRIKGSPSLYLADRFDISIVGVCGQSMWVL